MRIKCKDGRTRTFKLVKTTDNYRHITCMKCKAILHKEAYPGEDSKDTCTIHKCKEDEQGDNMYVIIKYYSDKIDNEFIVDKICPPKQEGTIIYKWNGGR